MSAVSAVFDSVQNENLHDLVLRRLKAMAPARHLPRITGVAIRMSDGGIFSFPAPYRHHHLLWSMSKILRMESPVIGDEGFVTSEGKFIDRVAGAELALKNGQAMRIISPPMLTSEDLW